MKVLIWIIKSIASWWFQTCGYFHPENWGNDPNFMNVFFKWVSSTTTLLMGRPCLTFIRIWRSDTIWTLINLQAGCPNPSLRTSWGIAKVKGKILLLGAWKKWSESLSCRWEESRSHFEQYKLKRITFNHIYFLCNVHTRLFMRWTKWLFRAGNRCFFGLACRRMMSTKSSGSQQKVALSTESKVSKTTRGSKRNAAGGLVESGIGLRRQIPGGAGRPLSALPNLQAQNGGGISRWHSAGWQGWRTCLVPLYSYRPASQYFEEGPLSEHSSHGWFHQGW